MDNERQVSPFDRKVGSLHGLPGAVRTRPTVQRISEPLVGNVQTFITQTVRVPDEGDNIFLEVTSSEGHYRLVIPPAVANTIARQRDALTRKSRSNAGRAQAAERKAAGVVLFGGRPHRRRTKKAAS